MEESGVDVSALSEKAAALAGQGETPCFLPPVEICWD